MGSRFLERYQAEAGDVLGAIFAYSRDCIKLLNCRGEIEYTSASAQVALGLADASEAIGRVWRDFWPEAERTKLDRAVADALQGSRAEFEGVIAGEGTPDQIWQVTISPVRGEGGAVTQLLVVSTNVTAPREAARRDRERFERAEAEANLATDVAQELRHRIKNQLAVVNAVCKLLARHTVCARELAAKLEGKLIALARAQDLLANRHDQPLTARAAVAEVLKASGAGERVEVGEMPDAELIEESVQQLALLLGELQTNALKHGALKHDGGTVRLDGAASDGVLTLNWREDCGSAVTPVESGHGGFQLIRRLGTAGGKTPGISWHPNGIAVQLHLRAAH